MSNVKFVTDGDVDYKNKLAPFIREDFIFA